MLRTEPCMTAVLPRLILLSLLAVACSGADRGYLPVVGPPPIRFALPPPPPPAEPVVLPPWPQTDAQPVAATAPTTNAPGPTDVTVSASSTPSTAATAEATKPEKVPPDAVGAGPNGPDATAPGQLFQPFVLPPGSPPPLTEPDLLTPQAFMRYFLIKPGAGTNNAGVGALWPVSFIPPQPLLAPPSSTATFETTPPGKP